MKILVIEARYYTAISDALLEGALDVLQAAKADITKVVVPGALEIPHVISMAEAAKSGFQEDLMPRSTSGRVDIQPSSVAEAMMQLSVDDGTALPSHSLVDGRR